MLKTGGWLTGPVRGKSSGMRLEMHHSRVKIMSYFVVQVSKIMKERKKDQWKGILERDITETESKHLGKKTPAYDCFNRKSWEMI